MHDPDTLKFSDALFNAMTELNRDSHKVWGHVVRNVVQGPTPEPTNTSYTSVQDLIQICVLKSGFIKSQLENKIKVGVKSHQTPLRMVNGQVISGSDYQEYTVADAVKDLKELQARLNEVTPALALYQQTKPSTSADATHIQNKLHQCQGAVGDFIRYIEQTFLPKQTDTWTSPHAVGKGNVPQRAQLLQMRACLDAC